ncbi:MAG: DUF3379 domain-containing protein [Gammaproteobacteria bacterium]|nr:DUF3379 domain-containing protein [Gammaproteobacteria bacterium]
MNCLEFRRLCLSEPATSTDAYVTHRRTCDECRRFAEGIDVIDGKLQNAMRVPVPENLTTRIKLRQILGDEHKKRGSRPWQWALAASVFLTVTLSGFFAYQIRAAHRYAEAVQVAAIEHVENYHDHMILGGAPGAGAPPQEQFQQVMATFGGRVTGTMAPVERVFICAMNKRPIAHAELPGASGIVTVLYVTGERLAEATEFAGDTYKVMLVPAGSGNLVVLGRPEEPLMDVVKTLKNAISWEI